MTVALRPMDYSDHPLTQATGGEVLILRPYRPGDEAEIDLRPDFAAALDAAGGVLPRGLRWTVVRYHDGQVLAVGGLEPHETSASGFFGCWGLAADLHPRQWAFVRRCARRVLAYAERELGARRIFGMAKACAPAIGLMQQMGFERYGRRVYGPDGAPYIQMIRRF